MPTEKESGDVSKTKRKRMKHQARTAADGTRGVSTISSENKAVSLCGVFSEGEESYHRNRTGASETVPITYHGKLLVRYAKKIQRQARKGREGELFFLRTS